jgi:outer membrane lipase/esterase
MRAIKLVASAAILALSVQAAAAAVWVFGDSNVDTGWYKMSPFSGNATFDFYLANAALYGIGKPTNNPGPMSVEVLARLLHMAASPANQGGTNYATSGAKNVDANTPDNGGFPNAVPTVTQIETYLQQHAVAATNDLFVIDSGANDVGYAVKHLTGTAQADYITSRAGALAKALALLQAHGAKAMIVVNQPESFGSADMMAGRRLYNAALRNGLASLHVVYAWGDANAVRRDIVANPATFGIQYTGNGAGQTACNQPATITSAWALLCSAASPVSVPSTIADHVLFADDQHWASGGHRVLGDYFYCLVAATWPQLLPPTLLLPGQTRVPPACTVFSQFQPPAIPVL